MTDHETPIEPPPDENLPSQDLTAERAVIGGIMLSRDALDECLEILVPSDFYRPVHEQIFTAAAALHAQGEPVDAITVGDWLDAHKAGIGRAHLFELTSAVVVAANTGYYARIVADRAVLRRLTQAGERIVQISYSGGDVADIVEQARATVDSVEIRAGSEPTHEQDVYAAIAALEDDPGVPTAWRDLTHAIGGWRPGGLYYLGARRGVGKSVIGVCVAIDVARRGKQALICSLEMSKTEIYHRMLSGVGSVDGGAIMQRRLTAADYDRLSTAAASITRLPLVVDDRSSLRPVEVRAAARTASRRGPLGIIVVDYLQLMSSGKRVENRQVEVAEFSRALKVMARELQVPILALSQLNRGLEGRADRRPTMSDLRESGALEQDADAVILLHRDQDKVPDEIQVIVAKHRHGPSDMVVRLKWEGQFSRAVDLSSGWSPSGRAAS